MSYNFNDTYSIDPWDGIEQNQRTYYDGLLRQQYTRAAVYSPYVQMRVDPTAFQTRTIVFNDLIAPRANIGVIGDREMNATRLYTDSYQKRVTVER